MIGTRHRKDLTSLSICSSCTTTSNSLRWGDVSTTPSFSSTSASFQRPILKSSRRVIIPCVPPAWSPVSPVSSPATAREFCLPRQEPRPPPDVLNRSSLHSCSPSLAKFSRGSVKERVSISTSTTTLPATINTGAYLHPATAFLTVNGHRPHHQHHHRNRQTR